MKEPGHAKILPSPQNVKNRFEKWKSSIVGKNVGNNSSYSAAAIPRKTICQWSSTFKSNPKLTGIHPRKSFHFLHATLVLTERKDEKSKVEMNETCYYYYCTWHS